MNYFWKLILALQLFLGGQAIAQTNFSDDDPFLKRCYTGGRLGLSLGSQSYIEVAPIFGYNVNHFWSVGFGLTWINYSTKYIDYTGAVYKESVNITGGSIFSRVLLGDPSTGKGFPNLFVHGELETIGYKNPYYDLDPINQQKRFNFFAPMLGLGYRNPIGRNSYYTISLLYIFDSDNPNNPYSQNSLPLIPKAGLIIGL